MKVQSIDRNTKFFISGSFVGIGRPKFKVFQSEVESRTRGSRPSARSRTQKNPRPKPSTALPRTDLLEAMDKNAQGQGPRTHAQVFYKKKKKKIKIKKSFSKKFSGHLQKKVFRKIFQAFHKILLFQKTVLSLSRVQGNF